MRAIARAQASTRATSLMCVKNTRATSFHDTYCLGHWNGENGREKTHQIEEVIILL